MTLNEFLAYEPAQDTADMCFIRKAKDIIRKQAETIDEIASQTDEWSSANIAIKCESAIEEILK